MATSNKFRCEICSKDVAKLVRHLRCVHKDTLSEKEMDLMKLGQRKTRAKETVKSYIQCCFESDGKTCNSYILENGYQHHLSRKHGIAAKSQKGKALKIKSKTKRVVIEARDRPSPVFPTKDTESEDDELVQPDLNPSEDFSPISPPVDSDLISDDQTVTTTIQTQDMSLIQSSSSEAVSTTTNDETLFHTPKMEWNGDEESGDKCDVNSVDRGIELPPRSKQQVETTDSSTQTDMLHLEENESYSTDLVKGFSIWLTSMDGGCYNEETSNKATLIIKRMLANLSFQDFIDAEKVCHYFTHLKGVNAASTSVYLRYFSSFLLFFHQKHKKLLSFELYKELDKRISRWHTSLKKKMYRQNIDKRRKIEHDTDTNIESIQMYLSSEIRTDLLNGMIHYNPKVDLTKDEYYKYRAALIGEIIFRNSQRAGVAIGLRTSEVKSGKSNGDVLKIVVHEHKTGKIKPAVIFMEGSAKDAILRFKEHIRPQMANSKSKDYFFISHIGNRIKHAGIQTSLDMLTKMVGAKGKITSTASRKAAATFIAISNPKKTQLSLILCNTNKTLQRNITGN